MKSKLLISKLSAVYLPLFFVFVFFACDKSEWEESDKNTEIRYFRPSR